MIASFMENTGEMLALLCVAGLVAVALRWRHAARRDFLAAFAIVLVGMFLREWVVWFYGINAWPDAAFLLSALARCVKITGAVLFIRAALKETCGEWGWISIVTAAAIGAAIV